MKKTTQTLIGALAVAVCASPASAATLLQDNFDSYANQAAFEAAWAPVGTQPSAVLTTSTAVSLPNSISVTAPANATSQRNGRSFTESGNPSLLNVIHFGLDFYDSDSTASPYREYANLQDTLAPGAYGQLIALGLNNNLASSGDGGNYYMARILGADGGTGSGAFFKLNDAGAPLRSTGWHNLAVDITDSSFTFYVDGILSQTIANTGTLRSYDNVRLGSGISSLNDAGFDNVVVSVAPVPEPSTIALGLLGGAGLMAGYFRRRGKK